MHPSVCTAYDLPGYGGSKDYARLTELVKAHSIICIMDYRADQFQVRDVARTQFRAQGARELWSVSARGFGYLTAFNQVDFISLCEAINLEFIEPCAEPEEKSVTAAVEALHAALDPAVRDVAWSSNCAGEIFAATGSADGVCIGHFQGDGDLAAFVVAAHELLRRGLKRDAGSEQAPEGALTARAGKDTTRQGLTDQGPSA